MSSLPKAPPVTPADYDPHRPDADQSSFLWCMYLLAVLIPVAGILAATYVAVVESRAPIRRHGIGLAVISVLFAVIWFMVLAGR